MNLRLYIICIAAALMLAGPAVADIPANIHGVVYSWDSFEPLDNAVVEVNSTPSQSMVAKYGIYSFELAPGAYTIKASYYQNGSLSYSAEEPITVDSEGNYVLDLLLLPVYSEELMESSGTGELSEIPETGTESLSSEIESAKTDAEHEVEPETEADSEETGGIPAGEIEVSSSSSLITTHMLVAFMLVLLLVGGYHFSLKQKSGEKKSVPEEKAGKRQTRKQISATSHEPEPVEKPAVEPEVEPAAEKATEAATEPITEPESEIPENTEESAEKPGEESVEEIEDTPNPKKPLPLPADLQEIMDIIRGQGGRITQKELRRRLKYSEGKVSLMLTDLERRGLVEKFKRGRGNVVIIKDENS